ncbi:MAG: serine/threonine protein kinase, partial [Anaerolineae bacterium]|nr:serine/threonine protein kinase [Anaerolineae bacterium]
MARVYQGYDSNLDRYAAVKVISGDFATADEAEYTERFQKEARAIARLDHPNIVSIHQYGQAEGVHYMAMAFIDGEDLRQRMKRYAKQNQHIPFGEVLSVARAIASALDHAHIQGVIHRDIKPSNIMINKEGKGVLTDFGLALSVPEGTMGDTFGTAHYIAPEQAVSSARAVPQSDLYALAVVLYEAFAGRVPFDEPSAMSVALKHLNDTPPPPSFFNPAIPATVERVLLKALSKEPKDRYLTGQEFVAALEAALKESEGDTQELDTSQALPPLGAASTFGPPTPPSHPYGSSSLQEYMNSLQRASSQDLDRPTTSGFGSGNNPPSGMYPPYGTSPYPPTMPFPPQQQRNSLPLILAFLALLGVILIGVFFVLNQDDNNNVSNAGDSAGTAAAIALSVRRTELADARNETATFLALATHTP